MVKDTQPPLSGCSEKLEFGKLERAKGIEPSYEAWEASVLPLNYARAVCGSANNNRSRAEGEALGEAAVIHGG
jgi:hypothetical protein